MAFVDDNRFDEQDQNLLNRDQMAQTPGGAATVSAGSSAGSRAGVGAGGTGGWTNVQAYLNANPANQGSANALKSEVGGQFDSEQARLNDQSSKAVNDAKGQVGQFDLNQAFSQYGSGDKQGAINSYQDYMNRQYQGPTQFSYGLDAKTQQYGDALQSRSGAQGLMNQVYNKAAGGQMTKGQRALQEQFDVNNPYTADAQNELSLKYGALKDLAAGKAADTQNEITNAQNQFQANRSAVTNNLNTNANALSAQLRDYESLKDQWNPEKMGANYEDVYNPVAGQYNMIQDFLGLRPVEMAQPTATAPKGEIAPSTSDNYFGPGLTGDTLNNFDESKYFTDMINQNDPWLLPKK